MAEPSKSPPSERKLEPTSRMGSSAGVAGPPSEPRPRASRPGMDADPDESLRPARAQMIALLVLGFVLVAVPLYLWRRPRTVPESDPALTAVPVEEDAQASTSSDASTSAQQIAGLKLGDPQVLECHDPGSKKTPPEQCDHLPELEKAFAQAIAGASGCVPRAAGGTVVYVADVSYARKKHPISLTAPAEGRTVKPTVASGCASAVGQTLSNAALDAQHAHQRYKVRVVATYP